VSDSEHVGYFMGHHSKRSVFDQVIVNLVLLRLKKFLVVSCERKDPGSLSDAGQSKYKIPLLPRVQIGHADANHAEGISWQFRLEVIEDISGIELRLLCILVDPSRDAFEGFQLFGNLDFHRVEEAFTIFLQLL